MLASRWGGRAGAVVGAVSLALTVTACSSDASGPKAVKTADAYAAAIRWYLTTASATTPTTADAGPVIVYVAPESGKAISSQTQASVVKDMSSLSDVVTVRFADVRDEVLETDINDLPVKDGAVLLLVGDVKEAVPPVDVIVDVYRSIDDSHEYTMTISRSGDLFEATQVSEVAQG